MRTLGKFIKIALFILLVIILALGCSSNRGSTEDSGELLDGSDSGRPGRNEMTALEGKALAERVRRIKQDIEKQKITKVSSVVIIEDTAVIGIIFLGNKPGSGSGMLCRQVENRVRKLDKSLNNVVVTPDPELYENITNIEYRVSKGVPLKTLARDIAEVLRNIDFSEDSTENFEQP